MTNERSQSWPALGRSAVTRESPRSSRRTAVRLVSAECGLRSPELEIGLGESLGESRSCLRLAPSLAKSSFS